MELQLERKLVLITGSTSGIGKAAAKSFLAEGAEVIVNGRKKKPWNGRLRSFPLTERFTASLRIYRVRMRRMT
ncbi:hypothetical protein BVAD3_31310 [Bacillus velezensis]|nr:hypothetical protein BVAD3_31310 [Bacillus velezensis]